jgi:nucleoside-triphosphatase THEP1
MKILLTAPPGLGKSTVIDRVVTKFAGSKKGIVAREILDDKGIRTGFTSVNQTGASRQFMFATDTPNESSIGGLFDVDVAAIDDFVVAELREGLALAVSRESSRSTGPAPSAIAGTLIYIDEIGRAQVRSARFLAMLREIFDSHCNVLGSIVYDDEPWSLEFKRGSSVCLVEITQKNRDAMPDILLAAFNHQDEFSLLSVSQQEVIYALFGKLLREEKFISARKLFDNALGYVTGGKVNQTSPGQFTVSGLTRHHKIARDSSGKFSCDCDLANGLGLFEGAPAVCSHEMSIKILES